MRILIVEDDLDLCGLMEANLAGEGHAVDVCGDGLDALRLLRDGLYDLVLLDRMLPGLDGLSVLKAARQAGVTAPVLMMTAMGALSQVIEGLDSGADDYIVKPFAVGELLARVRAVARRPAELSRGAAVEIEGLRLWEKDKVLETGGARCTLSKRECTLLALLMRAEGETLARGAIFAYVWGVDAPVEDANLDNYIHFVRLRLAEVEAPVRITTVRGVGYRLERAEDV